MHKWRLQQYKSEDEGASHSASNYNKSKNNAAHADESKGEVASHSASKDTKYKNTTAHGDESDYESTSHSAAKYAKLENTIALSTVGEQIKLDKKLARELDFQLNQDVLEDYQNSDNLTMQERSHNLVEQDKDAEQSVK